MIISDITYLLQKNNSIWLRDFTDNKIKAVKKVAFLHNVLNDAIQEINGIFAIEVSMDFI